MSSAPAFTDSELLHRQVHPNFVVAGRVSSQAFCPTAKDQNRLSVDRGSSASAEAAFRRYCAEGHKSAGVWSVTVGECSSLELPVAADPITDVTAPNPAHAYVDFAATTSKQTKSKAQILARLANDRGIQHAASE